MNALNTVAITPVSKMQTLVRREFQEYRILFLYVPVMVVLLLFFAFVVTAFRAYLNDFILVGLIGNKPERLPEETVLSALQGFASLPFDERVRFWNQFYMQSLPILVICYWGAMFYYYLMTLYAQRKNRSILFWNSLPVTDTETIFSKLLSGLLLCHGIYMVAVLALQLLIMGVMTMYGAFFDVPLWETFIAPAGILRRTLLFAGFAGLAIFWCLPVYAWFLLVSAVVRSAPFAWAMAPVVVVVVFELVFTGDFRSLGLFIEHAVPTLGFSEYGKDAAQVFSLFHPGEWLLSAILGAGFILAAIRFNLSEDC